MRHAVSMEELLPVMEEMLAAKGTVTFTVTGMSMWPMLRHGLDTVTLVYPGRPLRKYDIPLYRRSDGSFVLHRVVAVCEESYTCMGDHQVEREKNVRDEQVIGVVSRFCRGGRSISVNASGYQLYVRLWNLLFPVRYLYVKARCTAGRIRRRCG